MPAHQTRHPARRGHTDVIVGLDIGSTTCKFVLQAPDGTVLARSYERHHTHQAEKVLAFLESLEREHGFTAGRDRLFMTGSGAGLLAPLLGGKFIQEVVALSAAVEARHPEVSFVSEIGGEDMKTLFYTRKNGVRGKQVMMQSACSGGTGAFIEKTARRLRIDPASLPAMEYEGLPLHKISSKCGIFAETDANTLVKAGVPVEEIVASLFDAVVYQNLATLTKGNTPHPEVLLLGGPNLFFRGLQQAWRHHLLRLWQERDIPLPHGRYPDELIVIPEDAVYYAALGCVEQARSEGTETGLYGGLDRLRWWIGEGQHASKLKEGSQALRGEAAELQAFFDRYDRPHARTLLESGTPVPAKVIVGCDFGSTTAKAACLTPEGEVLFTTYALSQGNPIEDAKTLFGRLREALGSAEIAGLGLTGYGKDLLKDIVGADCPVVETVAHATAGTHFFPDTDCICDVGGTDVKIMLLRNGTVADFRLNSQCSSGNGAFLQGVAERFQFRLEEIAEKAFSAEAAPQLTMGCGVFLQSDIVNQQRKGWSAEEILAALCSILPLNVWVYAGGLTNLNHAGRKFLLQGGTHRNLAVVKAQVDFLRSRVPDAEVVVHPYTGEAGAIGAALVAARWARQGRPSAFRGFETISRLRHHSTTSDKTVCRWCAITCQRTFIDVELPGGQGRPWSDVPLDAGWERVIVNNACPKGFVENAREIKAVKQQFDAMKEAYPNVAETVRERAFRSRGA